MSVAPPRRHPCSGTRYIVRPAWRLSTPVVHATSDAAAFGGRVMIRTAPDTQKADAGRRALDRCTGQCHMVRASYRRTVSVSVLPQLKNRKCWCNHEPDNEEDDRPPSRGVSSPS